MSDNEPSQEPVSEEEKLQALRILHREFAECIGVKPDLIDQRISWDLRPQPQTEEQFELAKAKGFQLHVLPALQGLEEILPMIRTKGELDDLVRSFGAELKRGSTIAREQLDEVRKGIPRRGGPGRTPLLDSEESTVVCKEILKLVAKKYTVEEAITEVSGMCQTLVGKTVSKSTLWTIWGRRDEYKLW